MKITRKNLEKLFQNCGYSPEKIGAALLQMCGYKVDTYVYSDSVYVTDKRKEKIIYAKSR